MEVVVDVDVDEADLVWVIKRDEVVVLGEVVDEVVGVGLVVEPDPKSPPSAPESSMRAIASHSYVQATDCKYS